MTDNSAAFRQALAALAESGGGTLVVEPGTWLTGPIELFSHTTVRLEEGAVISFIPEPERYGPVFSRWEGVECYAMHPLVFARGQQDVVLTGRGQLEGNGRVWWDMLKVKRAVGQSVPETPLEQKLASLNAGYETQPGGGGGRGMQFLRPPLVQFLDCTSVRLEGLTLTNSPFWTVHPVYCQGLVISSLSIHNPHDSPNTDGIDIDSCQDVLVENCHVAVGDDGIALKSGAGADGLRVNRPTTQVTVRDCTVEDGHGGIVIGSETAGGIMQVLAERCRFRGTDRGIRIKTRRGRGGSIRDIRFRDLTMEDNLCPLAINMYYRCGAELSDGWFSLEPLPVGPTTPEIKNISIAGITASGCRAAAGFVAGLPESPVENLRIQDSSFSTSEADPARPDESDMFLGIPSVEEKSFRLLNVRNPELIQVSIHGPAQRFIYH
ncbi:MAG: glycoside hydrolase family 28 protein [Spirochaetaceae bacterium]|nr:glycoside hydrolase family 28 protein [Spirochaetaceae bacterium]